MSGRPRMRVNSWAPIGIFVLVAATLLLLLPEHTPHLLGWLPYLMLAACPLIHLFMHHGHGHGGQGRSPSDS